MDCIEIIGIASQYGTYYFLDYIVRSPNLSSLKPEKTVLVKKKKRHPGGKVLQIHWVGDKYLAQSLNLDYHLESKLLQAQFKGTITIIPEKKKEYTRIRTGYFLPSPDFFEAVDLIAGHIRSAYG